MHKKRLGCISPVGLLAGALTLLVITLLGTMRGGRMFSPGPLNAQASTQELGGVFSHAGTGGNCGTCHARPWERLDMSDHCLACHTDLTADPNNFHTVMLAQSKATECYQCHTDHRGSEAGLTLYDTRDFPHLSVGYSLQAHRKTTAGADFTCNDCHGSDISQFAPSTCSDCHASIDVAYLQAHTLAFGEDCLACHDGIDRYGGAFDHNRLFFPLEGGHASLACNTCHAGARTPQDLQNASTDCYTCHAKDDAHQGGFGQNCAACHTPVDWKQTTFDHSKAAFPLEGRHVDVACEACHVNNTFKGTPTACAACHAKDDAHQGGFGQDCAGCHTPVDWKQATFDHSKAAFPLDGQHVGVACEACHANNIFKGTPKDCTTCHAKDDAHHGGFGLDCSECHNTAGWSPARYDRPHPFPINHGEGGDSTCATCHPDNLLTYTCYGCHEHSPAEIASKHIEEGIRNFDDCMECHPTGQEEEGGGD